MLFSRKNIEKIFIVFFTLVLIIPLTGIFREKYNIKQIKLENRSINAQPDIKLISAKDFYTQTENWFTDRFLGRKHLLNWWNISHYKLGVSTSKEVLIGQDNWLFYKIGLPCDIKFLDQKVIYLKKLQNYCSKNNVKFLLLIPPNKEYIYSEYYPSWLKKDDYKYFQDKVEHRLSLEKINYLFLTEAMLEAKSLYQKELYFKDDHHWNYYGSFEGTRKTLAELDKYGVASELKILKMDNTFREAAKESSLASKLKIPYDKITKAPWNNDFTNELYEINESKGTSTKINQVISNDYVWEKGIKDQVVIENKSAKNNTTMLIIGDSYAGYMFPYITQTIKKVIFINYNKKTNGTNEGIHLEELINKYHPDVFVYQMLAFTFFPSDITQQITLE